MAELYWLPCDCGERHPVGARQAGRTIACACGRSLEVPTLRGLRELERARPPAEAADGRAAPSTPGDGWGLRQAGMFLGAVLLLGGLAWAGYLEATKPRRLSVEEMEPLQTWALWQELRTGADRFASPQMKQYSRALKQNRNWLIVSLVTAGAGAAVVLGTYALVKPSDSNPPPRSRGSGGRRTSDVAAPSPPAPPRGSGSC